MAFLTRCVYLIRTIALVIWLHAATSENLESTVFPEVETTAVDSPFFLIKTARNEDACTSKCKCSGSGFVDCKGNTEIITMPNFNLTFGPQVTIVDVSGTSIKDLNSQAILRNLIELDASNTRLTAIRHSDAQFYPNIRTLNARNAHITEVEPTIFLALSKLEQLDVSNNFITSFSSNLVSQSLSQLNLGQNRLTDITTISTNLKVLRTIHLSSNQLSSTSLAAWVPPAFIEQVFLRDNGLHKFSVSSSFTNLQHLQSLDISKCRLETMSDILLAVGKLPKLWKIGLAENSFTCNCTTFQEKARLAKTGIVYQYDPTCKFSNGTTTSLLRLNEDVCGNDDGKGEVQDASIGLYMLIAGGVLAFLGLLCLATFFVCIKRRDSSHGIQKGDAKRKTYYDSPYQSTTTLSTNISGSSNRQQHDSSHFSSQETLNYNRPPDPNPNQPKTRVFTKNANAASHSNVNSRAARSMGPNNRSQSEQWLDPRQFQQQQSLHEAAARATSTPLPSVPESGQLGRLPSYIRMDDPRDDRGYQTLSPANQNLSTYEELHVGDVPV